MSEKPVILIADPELCTLEMIFEPEVMSRLEQLGSVRVHADGDRLSDADLDAALAAASICIGQIDLPAERLARMAKLRATFNVEGNFLPNIDYAWCWTTASMSTTLAPSTLPPQRRRHWAWRSTSVARSPGPMRLSDPAPSNGGLASNASSFLLTGARIGIVGRGDLGSALRRMLIPFGCEVRVFDSWLAQRRIAGQDCISSSLDDVFRLSRIVFLFASSNSENQGFIGERKLAQMQRGSVVVVMSRAGIIDFGALEAAVREGHLPAGIDVFPVEPLPVGSLCADWTALFFPAIAAAACVKVSWRSGASFSPMPPLVCRRAERRRWRTCAAVPWRNPEIAT